MQLPEKYKENLDVLSKGPSSGQYPGDQQFLADQDFQFHLYEFN